MLQQALSIWLLAAFMAHSQPANDKLGIDSNTVVPPTWNGLLQAMSTSQVPNNSRPTNVQPSNSAVKAAQSANIKAAVYATRKLPPLKALLRTLDPTAKIAEGRAGQLTDFTCEWPDVSVRFTIKTNWNAQAERSGMKQWFTGFPADDQNSPAVATLLRKMDASVDCVGSVTTPAYDRAGKASSLVLGLAAKLDGYVFSHGSFYDATGAKIIGDANAPLNLKDQK